MFACIIMSMYACVMHEGHVHWIGGRSYMLWCWLWLGVAIPRVSDPKADLEQI